MDHRKQQYGGGSSSSSSFTENLFGPKDTSSTSTSSSGLFSTVFGSRKRLIPFNNTIGSSKKHEYGNAKHSTPDYKTQRGGSGEKQGNPIYHNETAEPSYLSSSIYYGGQEVYSPNNQTTRPHHTVESSPSFLYFKKDGGDDDPNGTGAPGEIGGKVLFTTK
ncbi:hypothetical protein OSB04_028300 [Centaurea solstitialis]|uniref:Uncharacterized protein n=1 Tax=Centaurea solstitialis TaxID=347529 RepID=A0AA38SGZ3_9ASTR|nr:hypothetical protein OSB04_028300 [Centaurea solstitialis]